MTLPSSHLVEPWLTGTRVPVRTLIDYIEGGHQLAAFLADFPDVSREHAAAVLELARQALLAQAESRRGIVHAVASRWCDRRPPTT